VEVTESLTLQLRHISAVEKYLLNTNISSTCPHMVNFGPLAAEIGLPVWGTPANFSGFRVLAALLSDVTHQRPTKLCTIFGRLLGWYTTHRFSGVLAHYRILPGAKFTLHPPSFALSYFGSVSARHLSSEREPNCGIEHRAPPIFGKATITTGIAPHSSRL